MEMKKFLNFSNIMRIGINHQGLSLVVPSAGALKTVEKNEEEITTT
jgi:hypothetical protein